ncbi:MAG TPA: hypothetical protein VMD02_01120 [Candidatus Omnitrophota bacterium]|nr:hypothetical protein [Candidatus Omnitrophota bacterium]
MLKKVAALTMLLFMVSVCGAQTASVKKTVAKKVTVKKAVAKVKKSPLAKTAGKAVAKPGPTIESSEAAATMEDKFSDLKDDVNKALADLKGQVEKVKSDNGDAKVGGTIFFRWQKYTQNPGTAVNNFDVDRAYVDIKKGLAGGANARITLDVGRLGTSTTVTKGNAGETVTANSGTQQMFDFLKYAYVELPVGIPSSLQFVPFELNAKLGLQQTVWIDWADKILNLRYIAKSFVDNEGLMSSADFGVGAFGKVTLPYLPDIEYQATVLNGAGYKSAETNAKKAVGVRLNTTAYDGGDLGKVIAGGFANVADMDTDLSTSGSDKLAGALVAYKHDLGTADIEYYRGTNKNGYSMGGVMSLGSFTGGLLPGLGAFARVDSFDPNTTKNNDNLDRSFYGVTYDVSKDVKLAMDMQNVTGGSAASASAGKTTSVLSLHSMVQL